MTGQISGLELVAAMIVPGVHIEGFFGAILAAALIAVLNALLPPPDRHRVGIRHVDWVPATQTVIASRGNLDLQLRIGSRTALVNGREVTLDVPATTMGGSTMVPLRFVGETLGADVCGTVSRRRSRWRRTLLTARLTCEGVRVTATAPAGAALRALSSVASRARARSP